MTKVQSSSQPASQSASASQPASKVWRTADILDLEAQVACDRLELQAHGTEAGLTARDAALGAAIPNVRAVHELDLLHAWVENMRQQNIELPGQRFVHAFGLLRLLGSGVCLLGGAFLALAVLRYDGTQPISLLAALLMLAAAPAVLAILSLGLTCLAPWFFRQSGGPLQSLVAPLVQWFGRKAVGGLSSGSEFLRLLCRKQGGRAIYAPIARRYLTELIHWWGLWWVCGSLLATVFLVLTTDLAFAWGSTIATPGPQMVAWLQQVALAFSWAWPAAVPSEELILGSRYNRLDGSLGDATAATSLSAQDLGTWWRFLVACIICYGFGSRLLSWLLARLAKWRVPYRITPHLVDVLDHQDTVARIRDHGPRFQASAGDVAPQPQPVAANDTWDIAAACSVVIWDEALAETAVEAYLRPHIVVAADLQSLDQPVDQSVVAAIVGAGHGVDQRIDAEAVRTVVQQGLPVVVLVGPDEQPLTEVCAFLRDLGLGLRTAAGLQAQAEQGGNDTGAERAATLTVAVMAAPGIAFDRWVAAQAQFSVDGVEYHVVAWPQEDTPGQGAEV